VAIVNLEVFTITIVNCNKIKRFIGKKDKLDITAFKRCSGMERQTSYTLTKYFIVYELHLLRY